MQCLEDKFSLGIIKYGFETQQNEKDFVMLEKQKISQKNFNSKKQVSMKPSLNLNF